MQFWRGFLAAILVIEMSMLALLFVRFVPAFEQMVVEFREAVRPPLFMLVTSTEWAIRSLVGIFQLAGNIK